MGISLISELEPKNSGSFALLDDKYIRGGLKVVETFDDLGSISDDRLKDGCLAMVTTPSKVLYTYDQINDTWLPFSSGGGGGGGSDWLCVEDGETTKLVKDVDTWTQKVVVINHIRTYTDYFALPTEYVQNNEVAYCKADVMEGTTTYKKGLYSYDVTKSTWVEVNSTIEIDSALSETSKRPVQNRVITKALEEKVSKDDVDNVISRFSENPIQNKAVALAFENIKPGITMTAEEYEALDDETKNDGSFYYISDTGEIYQNGIIYGGKQIFDVTQEEYDALTDEEKANNEYHCTDTGRVYINGILYGDKKPIEMTYEEYKQLEADGLVEPDVDYIIVGNESGVLLTSTDISHGDITVHETLVGLEGEINEVEKEIINFAPKNNIKVNTTRMIAHRGRSDIAPENTIPAYELAGDFGYWGGEVDLQKTSDGHFICLHDGTVDRTTNGIGSVSNLTLAEIQSLHIKEQTPFMGSAEFAALPYGEAAIKVPTLEEYLNACKQYNIVPVIELKEETIKATDIAVILDVVNKWEMTGQVVFIAFNDYNTDLLETIHSINPTIMCQPIMDFTRENIDYVANNFSPNCGIDPNYSQVTKELVEYAHSKGIEVNCWTCDDEIDKERLMSYGVDYITTNKLINPNLSEMKIGALGYELGGFDRVVDVLQKSFEMHSELYPNLVYCQNPVLGNHNLWDAQTIEQRDNGTTPYERAILTASGSAELVSSFTKRALDKTKYYVNEKTVYVSGLDFTKYKVTLVPFNEKGLFIADLGWFTKNSYVALPDRTQFVLFYFGRVDGEDITNEDLENMKQVYFCKTQRRRYVKLDSDFVFVTGITGGTGVQLSDMTNGTVSSAPTFRAWCFKGLNVKGYTNAKVHYLTEDYDIVIYDFVRDINGRLVYNGGAVWAEDGVEITLTSGAERVYFAFRRKDNAIMSQKDFINVSNSVMVEVY